MTTTDYKPKPCDALMGMVFEPIQWAIKPVIPEGLTLLCGKPKSGKSVFALNLCLSIATGQSLIGDVEHATGKCLYLALEDTERRLQARVKAMLEGHGLSGVDLSGLHYQCDWPEVGNGCLELLQKYQLENCYQLIVIDTLQKIKPAANGGDQYSNDYDFLSSIKKLSDKFNLPIICIHHTRKTGAEDEFDTILGSVGTTGAVDTMGILKRTTGAQYDATLSLQGRDIDRQQIALQENRESMSWSILGAVGSVQRTNQRQMIFEALAGSEHAATAKQITDKTGLDYAYVRKTLGRLKQEGTIAQPTRGRYNVP